MGGGGGMILSVMFELFVCFGLLLFVIDCFGVDDEVVGLLMFGLFCILFYLCLWWCWLFGGLLLLVIDVGFMFVGLLFVWRGFD